MTTPGLGLGLAVPAIAQTILDTIIAHYEAADGVQLPPRRVIAPGNPRLVAWDQCEQVVVTCSGIGVGQAPGEGGTPLGKGNPVSAMGLRHAVFAVQITRCVPESPDGGASPPADGDLTESGLAFMRDAGLLSQALVRVCTTVTQSLPAGSRVSPGAVESLGPEGGFAAVEGSLAATVGLLA